MKRINPLVITAAFAIAGAYIGILKIAGVGAKRIIEILLTAFTVDMVIDLVRSLFAVFIGLFFFALITAAGIYITGLFINWRARR